jgi:hypothetical protein
MAGDPFCGNCGYSFVGLTESSKCPECGKPIVEVLQRGRSRLTGRRYRSDVILFGLPFLHIALGPHDDEPRGHAHGIIAIGDVARGWLAIGGSARGFIAVGGRAIGFLAIGGFALGIFSFGGCAIGLTALGGGAVGGLAAGGGSVGVVAAGGAAVGVYAVGGGVKGIYVIAPNRKDPEAEAVFGTLKRFVGNMPVGAPFAFMMRVYMLIFAACLLTAIIVAAPLAAIVAFEYWRHRRREAMR